MFETPERIFVVMEKLKGGTCVLDLFCCFLFSFTCHCCCLFIPCNALSLFSCGKSGSRAAPERIENTQKVARYKALGGVGCGKYLWAEKTWTLDSLRGVLTGGPLMGRSWSPHIHSTRPFRLPQYTFTNTGANTNAHTNTAVNDDMCRVVHSQGPTTWVFLSYQIYLDTSCCCTVFEEENAHITAIFILLWIYLPIANMPIALQI